jgi:hypothetical protein
VYVLKASFQLDVFRGRWAASAGSLAVAVKKRPTEKYHSENWQNAVYSNTAIKTLV